jgi:large subunit ribosomal protein L9
MEVILLEKIGRLGDIGDQVNVKPGFGRNYLIPYGKAVSATSANKTKFEAQRAELEKAAADKLTQATGRARAISEIASLTITANASEEGKLFGSVGPREIEEAFEALGEAVNKSEVLMPEGPIRDIGEYDVELLLHSDVICTIKVIVAAE